MKELPIHIELHTDSDKTLYEQIYGHIREEIRAGSLLCGEKLPSARFLSDYLQVSRTTVDMAYGQLVAEGYVEARPKRGYFVAALDGLYTIETGGREVPGGREPEQEAGQIRFDFSPTAIDMSCFPYATWKKITKNILVDANSSMFSQGEAQGDFELRETICRYLHGARGVNCQPEQIIIGAGNDFLLLLLEKILGRHVPIAMENPTYERAYRIFRSFAYPVSLIPMDENGMCVDALRKTNARVAYVMPAHQYPTGISMPIGRRMELLKWAMERNERYLIEDDYDSEFRYKGKPLPSLQASDTGGKVVYIGTFSKSIAPAIRISYMVIPFSLLERYRKECSFYSSTVSRIDQRILDQFIREGHFERYLNKMRKQYRMKQEAIVAGLRDFQKDFTLSGENAGLHILLTDHKGRSEEELTELAAAAGVKVYPMSAFRMKGQDTKTAPGSDPFTEATVILGFGRMTIEQIRQGLSQLAGAWL